MTSVNTNAAALTALRTLQATQSQLETVQGRISTGFKIGEAKDNAAYWSISATLKSDNKSLGTVKDALGLGAATVDTAYQGLTKAKDVLDEIKSKLTAATQDGVDRNTIQNEISQLQDQLKSIAGSSVFSGENWLSVDSSATGYNATKSIVASFARSANNAVSIGTVNVDVSKVALFDANPASSGLLNTKNALTAADGSLLTVGGIDATGATPNNQGLGAVSTVLGTGNQTATQAVATLGTLNLVGLDKTDRITFNLQVDGGSVMPVTFKPTTVTNATNFVSSLQSTIDTAVGAGKVTVSVDASNNIKLTTASSGGSSAIAVTGMQAVDGDGVLTGLLGTSVTGTAPGAGTATAAVATTAPATDNTYTALSGSDTITFTFQYGSRSYLATLNNGNAGSATSEAAFVTALQSAIDNATDMNGGTTLGTNKVTAAAVGATHTFTLTTTAKGQDQAVGISNVQATGTSATTLKGHLDNGGTWGATTAVGTSTAAAYTFAAAINTSGVQPGDRIAMDVTFTDAAGSVGTHNSTVYISTAGVT
uniref:flagellin N-terminal helical domain-containing protein n=2 Tax=unclassified Aureimonas TaxID=2615206 RepID=UPI000785F35C